MAECVKIMKSEAGAESLIDEEVIQMVDKKHIAAHQLEKILNNPTRGVEVSQTNIQGDQLNMSVFFWYLGKTHTCLTQGYIFCKILWWWLLGKKMKTEFVGKKIKKKGKGEKFKNCLKTT